MLALHDAYVVVKLALIGKAANYQQSHVAEAHRLQVIVAHHKPREVVACHVKQHLVGVHRVEREGQHEQLRLLRVILKGGRLALGVQHRGVVAQTRLPQHSARVRRACLQLAATLHIGEDATRHIRHVSLRPTVEEVFQPLAELAVILLSEVAQSVDEHELGQDAAQRIFLLHLSGERVYLRVAVGQIIAVSLRIHLLLQRVHAFQVLEIFRVSHCLAVGRVGEVGEDGLPPFLSLRGTVAPHGHQIQVVIRVEAVDIVGIAL